MIQVLKQNEICGKHKLYLFPPTSRFACPDTVAKTKMLSNIIIPVSVYNKIHIQKQISP